MARHRFRSQPSLQRSSGPTVSAVAALAVIAVIGVGGGAYVGHLLQDLPGGPAHGAGLQTATATLPEASPPAAAAPAPAPPSSAIPPSPVVEAAVTPPSGTAPVLRKAKTTAAHPRGGARNPAFAVATAATPQERWEQQRIDYEIARAAYDASEREEGFRWAQRNNVRVQRYCRAAEQPASFVEGCMNYLRPGRSKSAATPSEPSSQRPPGEG